MIEETDACFIVRDANGQALAYLAALLSADAQRTVRCFYLIRTFRLRPSRETKRTFGRFDGDAACRSVGIVDELVELDARLRADFEIAIIVKAQARDADDAGLYVILMVDVAAGGQRVLAAVMSLPNGTAVADYHRDRAPMVGQRGTGSRSGRRTAWP